MDGNDCATACPAPSSGAGTVTVATDTATYSAQLNSTITSTITVTGANGFSGVVALTAAVTDASGTAISEWPVTLDSSMVNITMNGTATAKATIMVPTTAIPSTDATSMAGTLTVTATPMASGTTTVAPATSTAALAVANTLEIDMDVDATGKCAFPDFVLAGPVNVAVGTVVNWKNTGTATYVIHVNGDGTSGISHQGEGAPALNPTTTAAGQVWPEDVKAVVSGTVTWHCHAPDDGNDPANTIPVGFTVSMPQ
jgi:hypothetical protein